MASPSTPDFTTLARRPSERLAIVTHVRDTLTLEETDYLEWKSANDLSSKPGAAAIARQLVGMANRAFAQAERHAEGSAYVLVGVEPGTVYGVPHRDSADIENWLARYVQPELRYHVEYVGIESKEVLVFTVDAPRQGDPIYCLQRQCDVEEVLPGRAGQEEKRIKKTLSKGAIYVRHGGKTEQHTPEDLIRLTARAAVAERPTLDVAVLLDTSKAVTISEALASKEHRDESLRAWQARMLGKLPRREPNRAKGHLGLGFDYTMFEQSMLAGSKPLGETRSENEYKAEVQTYIQAMKVPRAWLQTIAVEWVKARSSPLGVSVRNNTDQNYENAVIELTLIGLTRGNVFAAEGDAARLLRVPEEPKEWGDMSFIRGIAAKYPVTTIAAVTKPGPEIEEPSTGQVLVRYPELRIRPHTTHTLEPLLLALAPFMAGESVPVHWRVTTSSTDGHQEGDIDFHVPTSADSDEQEPSEAQA